MGQSIVQERSFSFALDVVRLYRELQSRKEYVLSKQLLRSGTSIGANVEEASAGQSRRDFLAKMCVASKGGARNEVLAAVVARVAARRFGRHTGTAGRR